MVEKVFFVQRKIGLLCKTKRNMIWTELKYERWMSKKKKIANIKWYSRKYSWNSCVNNWNVFFTRLPLWVHGNGSMCTGVWDQDCRWYHEPTRVDECKCPCIDGWAHNLGQLCTPILRQTHSALRQIRSVSLFALPTHKLAALSLALEMAWSIFCAEKG